MVLVIIYLVSIYEKWWVLIVIHILYYEYYAVYYLYLWDNDFIGFLVICKFSCKFVEILMQCLIIMLEENGEFIGWNDIDFSFGNRDLEFLSGWWDLKLLGFFEMEFDVHIVYWTW